MRRLLAILAIVPLLALPDISGANHSPPPIPAWATTLRTTVRPGAVTHWRSPPLGPIRRLMIRADGQPVTYTLQPRTNRCVAYVYGQGMAARLTDCAKGRRTPYLRLRAVNANIKPVRLLLRLATR